MAGVDEKTISVALMGPDLTVRQLVSYMLDNHISHVELPFGEHLYVHAAVLFEEESSKQLVVHLDKVTLESIRKANRRGR